MLARVLSRFCGIRPERGSASVEFVIIFPIFLVIFMSSFEASLLLTRQIMLERGVDLAVRELRLGTGSPITHQMVREEVCEQAGILPDCVDNLLVELSRVSMATYALPSTQTPCVDKVNEITPVTTFENGSINELMIIRVCYTVDAMFPGSGLGLELTEDGDGDLRMVAVSAFVNEPI